ncbi:MAG: hypothetical protein VW397_03580, partial [Candidatus Margulisiibacteriota bacterium]
MNVSHLIKGFPRGSVRRFATLVPFPVDGYPTAQRIIHTPVKKPPPPPPTGDRNPLSNFIIGMITGAIGYGLVNSKTKEILEFEQDYNTLLKLHNELKKVTDQGGVGISFISSSRPIGPNAMPSEKEEYAKNIHLIVEDIHKNHANLIASQAPLVIINGGPGQPGSGMD